MSMTDFANNRFAILKALFPLTVEAAWLDLGCLRGRHALYYSADEPPSVAIPDQALAALKERLLAAEVAKPPTEDRELLEILKAFDDTSCSDWQRNEKGGWFRPDHCIEAVITSIPAGIVVSNYTGRVAVVYRFPGLVRSDWRPDSPTAVKSVDDVDDELPNSEPVWRPDPSTIVTGPYTLEDIEKAVGTSLSREDLERFKLLRAFPGTTYDDWDRNERGGWASRTFPNRDFESVPAGLVLTSEGNGSPVVLEIDSFDPSPWRPDPPTVVEISDDTEEEDASPSAAVSTPGNTPTPLSTFWQFYNRQLPEVQTILAKRLPELLVAWTKISNQPKS